MLQLPLATVPVQLSTPSLTCTLPVGVPVPVGTTVNCADTACPPAEGSGVSDVIVVVVSALATATLLLQPLLLSLLSALLLFGSALQLPPLRGFVKVAALAGVAVTTMWKEPLLVPSMTAPPLAAQVRLLLVMLQLILALPVTPLPGLATAAEP